MIIYQYNKLKKNYVISKFTCLLNLGEVMVYSKNG